MIATIQPHINDDQKQNGFMIVLRDNEGNTVERHVVSAVRLTGTPWPKMMAIETPVDGWELIP